MTGRRVIVWLDGDRDNPEIRLQTNRATRELLADWFRDCETVEGATFRLLRRRIHDPEAAGWPLPRPDDGRLPL